MVRRKVQPQTLTTRSSLAESIGVIHLYNAIAKRPIDCVSRAPLGTLVGSGLVQRRWAGNTAGWGGDTAAGGYSQSITAVSYPFSLFAYGGTSAIGGLGAAIAYFAAGTGVCAIHGNSDFSSTDYWQAVVDSSTGTTSVGTITSSVVNFPRLAVAVFRAANDYEIFVDGISKGTGSTNGPTLSSSFVLGVGTRTDHSFVASNVGTNGRLVMCGMALGEIPRSVQFEIARNPWILFAPAARRPRLNSVASGGSTIFGSYYYRQVAGMAGTP